jgi:hypothetical protein
LPASWGIAGARKCDEAGTIAAAFSVKASVVSGGVLCVVGVLLRALLLPRFVAYDARERVR